MKLFGSIYNAVTNNNLFVIKSQIVIIKNTDYLIIKLAVTSFGGLLPAQHVFK